MSKGCLTIGPVPGFGEGIRYRLRLTVRLVVELAAVYPNREELRREYPAQALLYAATCLDDRIMDLHRP